MEEILLQVSETYRHTPTKAHCLVNWPTKKRPQMESPLFIISYRVVQLSKSHGGEMGMRKRQFRQIASRRKSRKLTDIWQKLWKWYLFLTKQCSLFKNWQNQIFLPVQWSQDSNLKNCFSRQKSWENSGFFCEECSDLGHCKKLSTQKLGWNCYFFCWRNNFQILTTLSNWNITYVVRWWDWDSLKGKPILKVISAAKQAYTPQCGNCGNLLSYFSTKLSRKQRFRYQRY